MPDTTLKPAKPFMARKRLTVEMIPNPKDSVLAVSIPSSGEVVHAVAATLADPHPDLVIDAGVNPATCPSTLQLLYLCERYGAAAKTTFDSQAKADVMAVFQGMRDSVTASIAVKIKSILANPACPCWRFANGHAAYFGPVAYRETGEDGVECLRQGPASVFLEPTEAQASWTQETIAAVWGRWTEDEQAVYVECRLEGLRIAREWFVASYESRPGEESENMVSNVEIRLMVAQYAANAVDRYRAWRGTVAGGELDV